MKKLLLFKFLICIFAMNAQDNEGKLAIEKGTWNVGGQISLYTNNNKQESSTPTETNSFGFNINPSVSYFLDKNLSVGLTLGYGYNESKNINGTNENLNFRNSFSFIPTIKKFFSLSKSLALSLKGEIGYTYAKSDESSSPIEYTQNNYSASLRPGIDFFITKKLALQANLGVLQYSYSNNKSENLSVPEIIENKNHNFNFLLNSSNISFGLSYYM